MILKSFISLSLVVALTSCTHQQNIQRKLHSLVGAFASQGKFSGAVLVAHGDKILLSKGYGLANHELAVANTPQTKFRLASVTKQFTAMAIMQLQEQGLLNVHDKLSKYIADYPNGDKITIHHLLTHSSGIPNYTAFANFHAEAIKPHTSAQLVDYFKNTPLEFQPGEKFNYSNSGYVLLGYLIEIISKNSFENYIKQNIFDKLNMKNSGYDLSSKILTNRASGYKHIDEGLANSDYIDMSVPYSAGSLYSTVEDMYAWSLALQSEVILKKDLLSSIFTPHIAMDEKTSYGYGWMIFKSNNRNIVEHGGGIEGFTTVISRFIDDKLSIILLANIEHLDRSLLTKGLSAIVFNEPYELPKQRVAITLEPAVYDKLVGSYKFTDDGTILKIIKENNRLFACPDEEHKIELLPESATEFFSKIVEAQIIFTKDGLIFRNANTESHAHKIPY